jgi:hypothetical protein
MARQRVEIPASFVSLPSPRAIGPFVLVFLCVFGAFALPWAGFGATYSRAFSAVANGFVSVMPAHPRLNVVVEGASEKYPALALGVESWRTVVMLHDTRSGKWLSVPLDLRGAHYLPMVAFIALTVAFPVADRRRKLRLLAIGLPILIPLSLTLVALPLIPRLRGGPFELFAVSPATNSLVVVFYRAFVNHPGMAYAIPALLWWVLLSLTRSGARSPGGADSRGWRDAFRRRVRQIQDLRA